MKEKFLYWLAWKLPKKIAYLAAVRVIAHATSGKYSTTVIPELTAMEALKRWEMPNRRMRATLHVSAPDAPLDK